MALSIPIISEFDGKGLDRAIKEFKQLETVGEKAQFAIKKAAVPAAAALTAVAGALGLAAKAAAEDEQQQALLANTMRNVLQVTDENIAATEDMISAMSRASGTADQELRPAFSALLLGTKDVQQATDALALAENIAMGAGLELGSVADALSKAYAGNMRGLAALSPEMKGMIKDGASLDEVMAVLNENFGGAAARSAETAAGKFKILKNSLAETQESIGAALLPAINAVLPYMQRMADWAQKNPKAFLIIAGTISGIAAAIMAINIAMALNPFGIIMIGIGALITGLTIAYTKFEGFRTVVQSVMNSIIGYFEGMANAFISLINVIIKGINLIKPGSDIGSIGSVNLPTIGGAGAVSGGGFGREGGTGNIGVSLPSLPSLPASIITPPSGGGGSAGGGGGGGGGMGSGGIVSPVRGIQERIADRESQPININITGGLATSAEIGRAVTDSLKAYNRQSGPLEIEVIR